MIQSREELRGLMEKINLPSNIIECYIQYFDESFDIQKVIKIFMTENNNPKFPNAYRYTSIYPEETQKAMLYEECCNYLIGFRSGDNS